MPGTTLIEIIAYILVIPSMLTLIRSLASYNIDLLVFFDTYKAFTDWAFLISFILVGIIIMIMVALFIGYIWKDYKTN